MGSAVAGLRMRQAEPIEGPRPASASDGHPRPVQTSGVLLACALRRRLTTSSAPLLQATPSRDTPPPGHALALPRLLYISAARGLTLRHTRVPLLPLRLGTVPAPR